MSASIVINASVSQLIVRNMNLHTPDWSLISASFVIFISASLRYSSTKNTNLFIQVLNVTRASIVIKASSGYQRAGGMKEHTQLLKPHQCEYCDEWFYWLSDCKRHERVHSGVRPYKCKYCDKCFKQPKHCKEHERTHTWEKPSKYVISASLSCQMQGRIQDFF